MARRFVRRVVTPLAGQLRQGVTPQKLALALALGIAIGAVPAIGGVATGLCAVLGVFLGLNQAAIQVANYAAYPLQIALFLPFFRAGARLYGESPIHFSLAQMRADIGANFWSALGAYGWANVHAIVAWALLLPAAVTCLYFVSLRLLHTLKSRVDAKKVA